MMDYQPPFFLYNAHLQTIFPSILRKVIGVSYIREKLPTPDEDFLDLDWSKGNGESIVIVSHGLEGSSKRPYVQGMVKIFNDQGWDALAWNFRSCGGEINRQKRFYHSGATDDLDLVVQHVKATGRYKRIVLVGFSLGGNLTLKYLGECGADAQRSIDKAIVFSVPLHLHSSSDKISERSNYIYTRRFLRNLKAKVLAKAALMPEHFELSRLAGVKSMLDFDNAYTAPLHGFDDAASYYEACSSVYFLKDIQVPSLIINAQNDPFLSEQCFPKEEVKANPFITLEIPKEGGHCGFCIFNKQNYYWSELKAMQFADPSFKIMMN